MSGPPGAPPQYHVTLTRRRARQLVADPGWGRQSEYRSLRDCVCVCVRSAGREPWQSRDTYHFRVFRLRRKLPYNKLTEPFFAIGLQCCFIGFSYNRN